MEENSTVPLEYIISIDYKNRDYLGGIRHWTNLKLATNESTIWIKNFTFKQIESVEIKSIPYKNVFYIKDNKLFPYGSSLPVKNAPSLLWSPIEVGLPIKLPKQNHNYFGLKEKIEVKIIPSDKMQEPSALLTSIEILGKYIQTAPSVRFINLLWTIVDPFRVFIIGIPILPIPGETYWSQKDFLIPTGFQFETNLLTDLIYKKIDQKNKWIIWNINSTYKEISKESFIPLNRSSFRLSITQD